MMPTFDWTLSRTFLAVVRTGSFSAAGRVLGQAPPTVRRQIEQLERSVGSGLFSRSQDGVRTTPLADRLTSFAEHIEAAAEAFARASFLERFVGLVRIVADETIGTFLLSSILADLAAVHSGLHFEIAIRRGAPDEVRRSADIAVSFDRPTADDVITSRIATLETGLFASRDWIARNGRPTSSADLALATIIGNPADTALVEALGHVGRVPDGSLALATVDREMIRAAVGEGLGAGLLLVQVAERDPRLERILGEVGSTADIWMTTHADLRDAPQVRATMDGIRCGLAVRR